MHDKFTKLAKLAYNGASMQSMCAIFNLGEPELLQLMDMDNYKTALGEVTEAEFDFNSLVDKGWDGVEELAVTNVLLELKNNPDSDFALRAAVAANKAVRSHGKKSFRHNAPINVQNNMQAVIYVQPKFAERLQNDYIVQDKTGIKLDKKIINALNPNAVKHLLGADIAKENTAGMNMKELFNTIPDLADNLVDA